MIVPKAVYEYFVNGIPVEETIKNSTNIFDFCIGERSKSDSWFEIRKVVNGKYVTEKLPKTIRYYISNDGDVFKKCYDKGSEQYLVAHPQKGRYYKQTLFNKYVKKSMSDYNIDYSYYIKNAKKEIAHFFENQNKLL